jgi:hypothetical protein
MTINAASRTASLHASVRGDREALPSRSRVASTATLATSDQLGRPQSARYSASSGSAVCMLSRNAATISSCQTSRYGAGSIRRTRR